MLSGKRIVLGISGGIAAYKSVELCRRLMDAGAFVSPVMTESATNFVSKATFNALASEPVRTSLWDSPEPSPHILLGQSSDLIVVAPATARIISSYANGQSDDLLATTLLATRAPVVMCPAMHTEMWEHPAVQQNIAVLKNRGVIIVPPDSGPLAGGDSGVGRLAQVSAIVEVIKSVFSTKNDLAGKTVLVTSGGTKEPIDPVRFIGNRSSGKQGHAVAEVALERGARVILITTADLMVSPQIEVIKVETAAEMSNAVFKSLDKADIVVMAAAVADFRPSVIQQQKIKKDQGPPKIVLEPTEDILSQVSQRRRNGQIIVGFAAETSNVEDHAKAKLESKKLDLIVANEVGVDDSGFEHDTNRVIILDQNGRKYQTGLVEKRRVAASLFDVVAQMLNASGQ